MSETTTPAPLSLELAAIHLEQKSNKTSEKMEEGWEQ